MAETTTNPIHHASAQAEASIHAFLNSSQLCEKQAERLLSTERLPQVFEEMTPEDQERLNGKLNQVYTTVKAEDKGFLILFGDFCSIIDQFPTSTVLSTELVKHDDIAVAPGGLMDVARGECRGIQVAIKIFHAYRPQHLAEAKQILCGLVPIWAKLSHQNIVTFRGVTTELRPLALVYDWGGQDTIMKYTRSHPEAPRLRLLLQTAKGLQYLHSLDIPHGNLKESNVVVDNSGNPRLTDYGLAPINTHRDLSIASPSCANSRWLAPEIIDPPDSTNVDLQSKPADIFALGMLSAAVFTGELPFGECSGITAAQRISQGSRPEYPRNAEHIGLTPEIWRFFEKCWDHDPVQRPTIDEVVMKYEEQLMRQNARPTKNWWRWFCMG